MGFFVMSFDGRGFDWRIEWVDLWELCFLRWGVLKVGVKLVMNLFCERMNF